MSGHTAGPWKAHATELARSGATEYEIHWSDIGECVAEIVHGEANANLIAAAPELLEALESLVHLHLCEQEGMILPTLEQWIESVDKAAAAIAKAKGETK